MHIMCCPPPRRPNPDSCQKIWKYTYLQQKVKLSLYQADEAHRVVRRRESYIF
jgi:hypothetical protein